jgi:hypothetical protein
MRDLTVENMFTEDFCEAEERIPGTLGPVDRRRMLSHVMADITDKLLATPAANPAGLTITVNLVASRFSSSPPDLQVTATCPRYEMEPGFFKI